MPSKAANDVKMGFWIAAGFWIFLLVMAVVMILVLRAVKG